MKITVRDATLEDVPSICDVHATSAMNVYNTVLPQHALITYSIERSTVKWHEFIAKGGASFVAMVDERIVGFINIGTFRGDYPLIKGEIYELYVLPAYQRRKIGKALFHKGAQWLKRERLIPFGLWVFSGNTARHFYRAMGGIIAMQPLDIFGDSSLAELLLMFTS